MRGTMLNDSIINFYLSYLLTQHIDKELERANIEQSVAVEYIRKQFATATTGKAMEEEEEEEDSVQATLRRIFNQFAIATTFLYPQLRHLVSSVYRT